MRIAVLCLNFLAWRSCSARSGQGEYDEGNKTLANDATIGNAEIVNVLKTAD
jgi:hypothetical protein